MSDPIFTEAMCSGLEAQLDTIRAEMQTRRIQVDALVAQLAEAKAVLREVEWKGPLNRCPVCDGVNSTRTGHFPDCRLAKCLEEK